MAAQSQKMQHFVEALLPLFPFGTHDLDGLALNSQQGAMIGIGKVKVMQQCNGSLIVFIINNWDVTVAFGAQQIHCLGQTGGLRQAAGFDHQIDSRQRFICKFSAVDTGRNFADQSAITISNKETPPPIGQ